VDLFGPAGARFSAARGSDGTHEARGLPPGPWKGRVRARAATAWFTADFEAGTGSVPTLRPELDEDR
jgi:hypothetical protein